MDRNNNEFVRLERGYSHFFCEAQRCFDGQLRKYIECFQKIVNSIHKFRCQESRNKEKTGSLFNCVELQGYLQQFRRCKKMDSHDLCSRESPFAKFPDHTFCKQLEGDDNGKIFKYKWNHDLLCLVNHSADGMCNLVVVYDYSSRPGSVLHFATLDDAVNYLELFFERKNPGRVNPICNTNL